MRTCLESVRQYETGRLRVAEDGTATRLSVAGCAAGHVVLLVFLRTSPHVPPLMATLGVVVIPLAATAVARRQLHEREVGHKEILLELGREVREFHGRLRSAVGQQGGRGGPRS